MKIEVYITDYVDDIVRRIREDTGNPDFVLEGEALEEFKERMADWFVGYLDGSVKYIPEDLGYI